MFSTLIIATLVAVLISLRMVGTLGITETSETITSISAGHPPILMTKTLAADATARVKGTVMGKVTASGHYAIYNDLLGDGTEVARAILMEDVAIHAGATAEAVLLFHGDVIEDNLTGIDANGVVDLHALGIFCK